MPKSAAGIGSTVQSEGIVQAALAVTAVGADEAIWPAQFKQCFITLLFATVPFLKFVEPSLFFGI